MFSESLYGTMSLRFYIYIYIYKYICQLFIINNLIEIY